MLKHSEQDQIVILRLNVILGRLVTVWEWIEMSTYQHSLIKYIIGSFFSTPQKFLSTPQKYRNWIFFFGIS